MDGENVLPFAIEAEEWKSHLQQYRKSKMSKVMDSLRNRTTQESSQSSGENEEENEDQENTNDDEYDFPSVSEVRSARLRGETVDMVWLEQWRTQHQKNSDKYHDPIEGGEATFQLHDERKKKRANSYATFPVGFTRSYNFLGKKPQDIRVGDIPQLLAEYHQLVNVCEAMVSERNAVQKESQKLRIQRERNKLEKNVVAADEPSV